MTTDAKLLAANALESAWRAYERNEADLTRLGHEFRLHAEIVLQALRSTQYVPPPQDAMQAALWRDVALLNPLERYALAVLEAHRDEIGDLDGAFLQDKAEACGLLESIRVTEPCGESCRCAEYDDFPQDCLRLKPEFETRMSIFRSLDRIGAGHG